MPKGTSSSSSSSSSSSDSGIIRTIEKAIRGLGGTPVINKRTLEFISKLSKNLKDSNVLKIVNSFVNDFVKGGYTTSTMQSQSLIANILKFLSQY
jgi:hypothetical protein